MSERSRSTGADKLGLADDEALLVAGTLNVKPEDRTLTRDALVPVQAITAEGVRPVEVMRSWGAFGTGCLLWDASRPELVFVGTLDEVGVVDVEEATYRPYPSDDLVDVHEVSLIDGQLWIASTGSDHLSVVDPDTGERIRTVRVANLSSVVADAPTHVDDDEAERVEVQDRFHVNQAFQDLEGRVQCLVHHVSGKQLVRWFAKRVIKSQGDGGVLAVDGGEARPLDLWAPHTVRVVNGRYWLHDSGNSKLRMYDRAWEEIASMNVAGWGRGGSLGGDGSTYYAGVSAMRRRYLGMIPAASAVPNMVQAIDVETRTVRGELALEGLDQVYEIVRVPIAAAEALTALEEVEGAPRVQVQR